MSKHDVIKPGQFKLAGKLRPSDTPGIHELTKEEYSEEKAGEARPVLKPEPAARARKKSRLKGPRRAA